MNRGNLRDRIRKKLGETTSAFWTDTEINDYINDGCRDISYKSKCLRANTYVTTTDCTQNTSSAGTTEISFVSIDPLIYSVLEVYFHEDGANWIKLDPTNRTELDIIDSGWKDAVGRTYNDGATTYYNYESEAGTPVKYYWDREEDLFGWWVPTDTQQTNSNNMRVYFCKKHTDLTTDSEEPQIPEPLQLTIIDYGIAQGLEDRGWQEKANDRWQKYYTRMREYMAERNREQEDEDLIMKNYRNV